ncbi:hypothetical protein NMY22_g4264 [Coprinellus aureogranulatus]|nr:hypothetical protein NMY22_g4264 [Coprinellus aureogranulatus]
MIKSTPRVLIATIKSRSDCPCPVCLVKKKDLGRMGSAEDIAFNKANPRVDSVSRQKEVENARAAIQGGLAVAGDALYRLLSHSGVPINAFSSRLFGTGFNIFSAIVVDILHEYEIGVFKALFLHLIRVLEASASGSVLVHQLDRRYRAVPTFNQTIRKFSTNVSQLRRRAARDYEDLLQCSIPAFQGLLPEPLNELVLRLLYLNAQDTTSQLGKEFRRFIRSIDKIKTVELLSEARKRERSQKAKKDKLESPGTGAEVPKRATKGKGKGKGRKKNEDQGEVQVDVNAEGGADTGAKNRSKGTGKGRRKGKAKDEVGGEREDAVDRVRAMIGVSLVVLERAACVNLFQFVS